MLSGWAIWMQKNCCVEWSCGVCRRKSSEDWRFCLYDIHSCHSVSQNGQRDRCNREQPCQLTRDDRVGNDVPKSSHPILVGRRRVRVCVCFKLRRGWYHIRNDNHRLLAFHFDLYGRRRHRTPCATLSHIAYSLCVTTQIRECRMGLKAASKGGTWYPDLSLVWALGNVWLLEMILTLPGPFFSVAKFITGLPSEGTKLKNPLAFCVY